MDTGVVALWIQNERMKMPLDVSFHGDFHIWKGSKESAMTLMQRSVLG
jgi:hypothetical protein